MSRTSKESTYFYTGSAVALGGFLSRPDPQTFDSTASAALSPTGGYAAARIENYNFRDLISFQSASSHVVGNEDPESGSYSTSATVTIKGLDILGMVTADAVVARMASVYEEGRDPERLRVSIRGSHFVNLRIGGELVQPRLISLGEEQRTYQDPNSELSSSEALTLSMLAAEPAQRQSVFESKGVHGVHISQFGTVYLGEFIPHRNAPRLIMLRVQLGCSVDGETAAAIVESGGREWP